MLSFPATIRRKAPAPHAPVHILDMSTFGHRNHLPTGDDDVLGGFQECQPYLHFKEGD
jgi:hypothetical protein